MKKMQESEFENLQKVGNPKTCRHQFVKLYYNGTHTDYGCVLCKIQTMNPE